MVHIGVHVRPNTHTYIRYVSWADNDTHVNALALIDSIRHTYPDTHTHTHTQILHLVTNTQRFHTQILQCWPQGM